METLQLADNYGGPARRFDIVESVPHGYMIWNIGKNMVDGYLPLCRLSDRQPFAGGRDINVNTLKAIKCEGAQIILAACGFGPATVAEMEKYLEKYTGKRKYDCAKIRAALPYMKKIKGL